MTDKVRLIGVNDAGRVIGEDHGRAVLTDADVERMRTLHEDSVNPIGYRRLAKMFECSVSLVKRICRYQIRCQVPARYKRGT